MPGPYHFQSERRSFRPRLYVQDTWKLRSNLTVNYGLGWEAETGDFPSDLPFPALVDPLFGAPAGTKLPPTPINWRDFLPALGFNWSPGKSGKTVIRGGAGLYWDTVPLYAQTVQTSILGPQGNGRILVTNNLFTNTFPGIVQLNGSGQLIPLPVGAALPLATFTNMTLGQFNQIYAAQYGAINARFEPANPETSGPYSVSNLDVTKTASQIPYPKSPLMRSYQTSIGAQRDLGHNMVLTADWARRQFENVYLSADLNHYAEYNNGVQTPAIPHCTAAQVFVPGQECSSGGLSFYVPEGRSVYEGLLVKLEKTFVTALSIRCFVCATKYEYQRLDR